MRVLRHKVQSLTPHVKNVLTNKGLITVQERFFVGPKKYCEKARIEQGSSGQAHTQKMSCHSLKVRIDDRTELSRSIVVCVITVDFYTAFLRVNLQFIFCPIKRGQNGI